MTPAINERLPDFYPPGQFGSTRASSGWMSDAGARKPKGAKIPTHIKPLDRLASLLTPGELSSRRALVTSILAMAMLFSIDLLTPPQIHLDIFYLFPLAAIALHCERPRTILASFALAALFQYWTFVAHGLAHSPSIIDGLIMLASSVMTMSLARASRANYLATMNLAATDWLTGIHNRRSFDLAAEIEISRQRRYGGAFSLAVIDLDGFKKLNDSKGHHAGDVALKLLARILREHTRETDFIARLGGDEFAVLMPNTKNGASLSLCRQLAVIVASRMARAGFGVTASIGCASFEEAPESIAAALQRADLAMYAAKAKGKGCALSL